MMGEANRRGTFKERKTEAVERDKRNKEEWSEIQRRKPSPKHGRLGAVIAGIAIATGVDVGKF